MSDLTPEVDVVGLPLSEARRRLDNLQISYDIRRTGPVRDFFPLDNNRLYVVRQAAVGDRYVLTAAAGLRREVYRLAYKIGDACVKCGACAATCPVGAITKGENQYEINPDVCVECGSCAAGCLVEAISAP